VTPTPAPRRLRLGEILIVSLTVVVALVTLLGLEPPPTLPAALTETARAISSGLIQIVTIVAALALVIGVANLLLANFTSVRKLPKGLYNLATLIAFFVTLIIRGLERAQIVKVEGTGAPLLSLTVLDAVQVAVESALAGLLFFVLVYMAYRVMRRGVTIWKMLFIGAAVIVLIGYNPLPGTDFLAALREWLLSVPVTAGVRGLLIGVALGTLVVGVRVFIGRDRTFRE